MRRAAAKKDVAQLDLAHGIVMNIERPKATTPFDLTPAPLVGDPLLFDT